MKEKIKNSLSLFVAFFKLGLFTFGGGYAMIPLLQNEFVTKRGWIEESDLVDMITISESTPGPVAINCATYIGYSRGGVLGSVVATLGVITPPFIIIYLISLFFSKFLEIEMVAAAFKGISIAVAVLIFYAAVKLLKNFKKNVLSIIILILVAVASILIEIFSLNFSAIYFILIGGISGILFYGVFKNLKNKKKSQLETKIDAADNKEEN